MTLDVLSTLYTGERAALALLAGKSLSVGWRGRLHKESRIHVENVQITDISPLASLTNLKNLDLHNNQITDISPLASLTNLKNLYLYGNQITDISPLVVLTNLEHLYLHNNQITDISPLVDLPNLTSISLTRKIVYLAIAKAV